MWGVEFAVAFAFVLFLGVFMLFASAIFGPKGDAPQKKEPFECGVDPLQKELPVNFQVHFYRIALMFLLFDLEVVFLIPWALAFRDNKVVGFVVLLIFQLFVIAGLVYAWKKGDFEWER